MHSVRDLCFRLPVIPARPGSSLLRPKRASCYGLCGVRGRGSFQLHAVSCMRSDARLRDGLKRKCRSCQPRRPRIPSLSKEEIRPPWALAQAVACQWHMLPCFPSLINSSSYRLLNASSRLETCPKICHVRAPALLRTSSTTKIVLFATFVGITLLGCAARSNV